MFTIDPKFVGPFCFKMLPLNFTFILAFSCSSFGKFGCVCVPMRLRFWLDNPFDSHEPTRSGVESKYLYTSGKTK